MSGLPNFTFWWDEPRLFGTRHFSRVCGLSQSVQLLQYIHKWATGRLVMCPMTKDARGVCCLHRDDAERPL